MKLHNNKGEMKHIYIYIYKLQHTTPIWRISKYKILRAYKTGKQFDIPKVTFQKPTKKA